MAKKIGALLAFATVLALAFIEPPGAAAVHEGHQHQQHAARRARTRVRAARARARAHRRAVSYVCPMHPDMRSKSRGRCPKCGMALVAERRGAKVAKTHEEIPAAARLVRGRV